jgi:hypothetical protein
MCFIMTYQKRNVARLKVIIPYLPCNGCNGFISSATIRLSLFDTMGSSLEQIGFRNNETRYTKT